jgi:limonene-1,2-epoxide hydrolase
MRASLRRLLSLRVLPRRVLLLACFAPRAAQRRPLQPRLGRASGRARRGDVDGAVELLAVDVEYKNVSLPAVHGRERVRRLFGATLGRTRSGFDVYLHAFSALGPTVLTERTDVLKVRRLRVQVWVCGRFDVHDGKIVLWRDYFDHLNFNAAMIRGMIGVVLPAVRAKPPAI